MCCSDRFLASSSCAFLLCDGARSGIRGDVEADSARRSPVEVDRRAVEDWLLLWKYVVESCGVGEAVGEFSTDDVSVL